MIRAAWQALVGGPLRAAPGRSLLAVLAIAGGVALGFSVHLINASANAEFRRAALQLAGEADLVIRGPRQGFDEMLFPRVAGHPGIAVASPALEFQASLSAGAPVNCSRGCLPEKHCRPSISSIPTTSCSRRRQPGPSVPPPVTAWLSSPAPKPSACVLPQSCRMAPIAGRWASWISPPRSGASG